jgi:hypothetical protein
VTPKEFIHALECWQLEVKIEPSPIHHLGTFWDVEARFGSNMADHRVHEDQMNKTTVEHIAKSVLGTCYDCGGHSIHPNVKSFGGSMCRQCSIKGGDYHSFRHMFDLDKLREKVGSAELRMLIQTCTWEGPGE